MKILQFFSSYTVFIYTIFLEEKKRHPQLQGKECFSKNINALHRITYILVCKNNASCNITVDTPGFRVRMWPFYFLHTTFAPIRNHITKCHFESLEL